MSSHLQRALRLNGVMGEMRGIPKFGSEESVDVRTAILQQLQWDPLAENARPVLPEEKRPVSIYI